MKYWVPLVFLCLSSSGCAFTQGHLNVSYAVEKAEKGPLSTTAPLTLEVGELTDQRQDKEVIGHKVNGIGMETADIVTEKPVPEIMRSALQTLFAKNGLQTDGAGAVLVADGVIKQFWVEIQMNMMTIEFMGTVTLDLSIKDKDRNVLYTREYQGHYNEKKAAGYMKTCEKIMNITLEKLMYQIATDQDLVKALSGQTVVIEGKKP